MISIERISPIRIGASLIVGMLRADYQKGGDALALDTGRQCLEGVPDAQILAIAREDATLRGFSHTGITYHDVPCAACNKEGRVPRYAHKPEGSRMACPTCDGDGFAPPVAVEVTTASPDGV